MGYRRLGAEALSDVSTEITVSLIDLGASPRANGEFEVES